MLLSEITHASNNMHKNIQHCISRSNIRYTELSMGRAKTDYIELYHFHTRTYTNISRDVNFLFLTISAIHIRIILNIKHYNV